MPSVQMHGREVLVDEQDMHLLHDLQWAITPSDSTAYVQKALHVNGKYVGYRSLHRLITGCPDDLVVDHINGNGLDNRRENLRICTHAENLRNRKVNRNSSSGLKGVELCTAPRIKNPWRARITLNGKRINLGCFQSPELAHAAYCEAANRLHGEFARTA